MDWLVRLAIAMSLPAIGLAAEDAVRSQSGSGASPREHWAFRPLESATLRRPIVRGATAVDDDLQLAREQRGLTAAPPADRATRLRRLSFDLCGLPPTAEEVATFLEDNSPDAWARQVDRLLASPSYGERWGKYWLDAVGYADSNGYFNADTDRPLAHQYRDYVIRAWNADWPFDEFVREQLAGDELAAGLGERDVERRRTLLTATHFLRNAQDGTGESDGNPDERTVDRATVLEGAVQITVNSLLALTIQCARCHEHKFEPIAHEEYYQLASVLYPAFPAFHADKWVTPQARVEYIATDEEHADWQSAMRRIDDEVAALRSELAQWVRTHRVRGQVLFEDPFDASSSAPLADAWSATVTGDDAPAGTPPIQLEGETAPAARRRGSTLQVIESGGTGDRWLSTRRIFDWTPDGKGAWIQVTFDLVADRVASEDTPAARIGFGIALHDFNDNSAVSGGNILIDGNPDGGAAVHLDYPGADSRAAGAIGISGYRSGHNYGVRVVHEGEGRFRLEQLVDWQVEDKALRLTAADLPDGTFGFEYCCGRSFVVDNVAVESSPGEDDANQQMFLAAYRERRAVTDAELKRLENRRRPRPGGVAIVRDVVFPAPATYLLQRGNYADPGEPVQPAGLAVLSDNDSGLCPDKAAGPSSGRRLAFARWLTRRDSRASALLARVIVNRLWQYHFGTGLVPTADNFGLSGARPTHPELLDALASELVRSGWSIKAVHRGICLSDAYQQSSVPPLEVAARGREADPDNLLLWRFPLRRLDAEAVRDGMLWVTGELDGRMFGPYVPGKVQADGEVMVPEDRPDARRRSIYLQQRRTQLNTLLQLFDAPSMVSSCAQRSTSTVPLQSLVLLNSDFLRARAGTFALRILAEVEGGDVERAAWAFTRAAGRPPHDDEAAAAQAFLDAQRSAYPGGGQQELRVWTDFCQMLLASNAFLYLE